MPFLDKLERLFGRFAIPNLSIYIVVGQVFVLLASMFQLLDQRWLTFAPVLVTELNQWWRIVTFLFIVPVPSSLFGYVFLAFGWYLFYLMGGALEGFWGTFRYNLFFFLSFAITVALSFITPTAPVTNVFILGTIFLAFAYLNPDFELTLFFILPIKIKWLALFAWAVNAYLFITGDLATRLQIGGSVVTFFLFFGGGMIRGGRQRQRTRSARAEKEVAAAEPRHVCHVCGKTDITHPDLDFRYCSKCAGDQCYCPEHIQNHAHVVAADDAKAT